MADEAYRRPLPPWLAHTGRPALHGSTQGLHRPPGGSNVEPWVPTAQHCWVIITGARQPGLLLEWRRNDDGRWQGSWPVRSPAGTPPPGSALRCSSRSSHRRASLPAMPREVSRPAWLTTAEAAEVLGVSTRQVRVLARNLHLPTELVEGRLWLDEAAVRRLAVQRAHWISEETAADMTGFGARTIGNAARAGHIASRRTGNRSLPGLDRASVLAWAQQRRTDRAAAEHARADAAPVAAAAVEDHRARPPQDGQVWYDARTAGVLLGISRNRVNQLALLGKIPSTLKGDRRWYRRDHLEQIAAARAFTWRRQGGA